MSDRADFTINYPMLKELGKMQYSNHVNAISELVANSVDAESNNIIILIKKSKDKIGEIRIIDDGFGMNKHFVKKNYVKIGFKKRSIETYSKKNTMGRKGIGKLSALYLSDNFLIATKTKNCKSWNTWEFNFDKSKQYHSDETPSLIEINDDVKRIGFEINDIFNHGTEIWMKNVDLNRFGIEKIDRLKNSIIKMFTL